MAAVPEIEKKTFDPVEVSKTVAEIAQKSQKIVADFLKQEQTAHHLSVADAMSMGRMYQEVTARLLQNPLKLAQQQMSFMQNYWSLWQNTTLRMMGMEGSSVVEPNAGDRRFRHEAWDENPLFDFIKQSYLLAADYLHRTVEGVEGMDDRTHKKVDFFTRQFVDALSPTNFLATNPEALRETLDSRGENLLNGLKNMLGDIERGKGSLKISMTDMDAFEVGENVALTPGKVVYQNDLIQLLQYEPTTEKVSTKPVMIVPPWINKFYIMDLRPANSLIKWVVDQGYTVFVLSWINPDEAHAEKAFDNYLTEGTLAALDAIEEATGEHEVLAMGYCLGGTLLASTLAYLAAKGDERIKGATFMTTMIDFAEPGELEIFIDEEQIRSLEKRMNKKGYLAGGTMATTFSSLRANDLIWSYFVNNYLKGQEPFPFDLLYWNSDSTNMPAAMHSFYLRNMYQYNKLKDPGGITLCGEPVDLGKVTVPVYFISTTEDHIAPWTSTYAGTKLFGGPVTFVLGGSGHIAGIINPPAKNKYGYRTNARLAATPDTWLKNSKEHEGSWWIHWDEWAKKQGGAQVKARTPGDGKLKVIEDAPGSYVKMKAE